MLGACSENDACEWRGGERAKAAAEGPGGKFQEGGKPQTPKTLNP